MFFLCYTWIIHLFRQNKVDKNVDYDDVEYFDHLPDVLIVNILSRLPTQSVAQCRKVCKKWWMLTSSSQFIELHQTTVKPLTLLHWESNRYLHLYIIDDEHRITNCNLGRLHNLMSVNYLHTCNGLVLLFSSEHFYKYHVLNPLSAQGRIITIDASHNKLVSTCGFFFHPLAKEYRILSLWQVETRYEYHIYLFGAKMWRRTANPDFNGQPLHCMDVAIVNKCLHWCTTGNRIMVFDMITEEFSFRLTPVKTINYKMRNLLVKEDRLCFFDVRSQGVVMDIWILEDYEKWSWIKKYVVDLDWDVIKYPMDRNHIGCEVALSYVNVISIHKNELMVFWKYRGLFSYDLGNNTIKKIHVDIGVASPDKDLNGLHFGYRAIK